MCYAYSKLGFNQLAFLEKIYHLKVLPLSGVVTSGGGKMMMPAKVRLSEDINIQSNSTIGVSNAPKSGTIISGEGTEPVVQTSVSNGSEVSGKVIVSAATIKRCGTKACPICQPLHISYWSLTDSRNTCPTCASSIQNWLFGRFGSFGNFLRNLHPLLRGNTDTLA